MNKPYEKHKPEEQDLFVLFIARIIHEGGWEDDKIGRTAVANFKTTSVILTQYQELNQMAPFRSKLRIYLEDRVEDWKMLRCIGLLQAIIHDMKTRPAYANVNSGQIQEAIPYAFPEKIKAIHERYGVDVSRNSRRGGLRQMVNSPAGGISNPMVSFTGVPRFQNAARPFNHPVGPTNVTDEQKALLHSLFADHDLFAATMYQKGMESNQKALETLFDKSTGFKFSVLEALGVVASPAPAARSKCAVPTNVVDEQKKAHLPSVFVDRDDYATNLYQKGMERNQKALETFLDKNIGFTFSMLEASGLPSVFVNRDDYATNLYQKGMEWNQKALETFLDKNIGFTFSMLEASGVVASPAPSARSTAEPAPNPGHVTNVPPPNPGLANSGPDDTKGHPKPVAARKPAPDPPVGSEFEDQEEVKLSSPVADLATPPLAGDPPEVDRKPAAAPTRIDRKHAADPPLGVRRKPYPPEVDCKPAGQSLPPNSWSEAASSVSDQVFPTSDNLAENPPRDITWDHFVYPPQSEPSVTKNKSPPTSNSESMPPTKKSKSNVKVE